MKDNQRQHGAFKKEQRVYDGGLEIIVHVFNDLDLLLGLDSTNINY
jgi:hypothetical protein